MEQGQVNDLDYEDNDETIMNNKMFEEEVNEKDEGNRIIKKVDGRVRLLKKLDKPELLSIIAFLSPFLAKVTLFIVFQI